MKILWENFVLFREKPWQNNCGKRFSRETFDSKNLRWSKITIKSHIEKGLKLSMTFAKGILFEATINLIKFFFEWFELTLNHLKANRFFIKSLLIPYHMNLMLKRTKEARVTEIWNYQNLLLPLIPCSEEMSAWK